MAVVFCRAGLNPGGADLHQRGGRLALSTIKDFNLETAVDRLLASTSTYEH